MSTINVNNVLNNGGSALPDNLLPVTATAWVKFKGDGTVSIFDSHNVSSITDQGVGLYKANFAVNTSNIDYSVTFSSSVSGGKCDTEVFATDGISMASRDSGVGLIDAAVICVMVFGGQ